MILIYNQNNNFYDSSHLSFFSYAVYIFSCIKASNISPFTPDYKSL